MANITLLWSPPFPWLGLPFFDKGLTSGLSPSVCCLRPAYVNCCKPQVASCRNVETERENAPPLPKELEKAAFKWLFPTYHSRSQCDELAKASADFSSPYLWRKGQLWLWCQSLACHFAVWHTLVTLCPLQHGHQVDFVILWAEMMFSVGIQMSRAAFSKSEVFIFLNAGSSPRAAEAGTLWAGNKSVAPQSTDRAGGSP